MVAEIRADSCSVLCLHQNLEPGCVGEEGLEGYQTKRSQLNRIWDRRQTCREPPYVVHSADLEIRAKIKCYGSQRAFLPKKGLRDSFQGEVTP